MRDLRLSAVELDELVDGDEQRAADLAALVALLDSKLKPGRLPAVMLIRAAALGDRSLLDVVRDDGPGRALAVVRESFAWDTSA